MHPALLELIRLNLRAKVRRLFRGLRGVKGIGVAIGALFMLAPAVSGVIAGMVVPSPDAMYVRTLVSSGLLMMCALQLFSISAESGIAFQPAEVDLLFPGPFTRRQLLLYQWLNSIIAFVPLSLLFACYLTALTHSWFAAFAGCSLSFVFIMLFGQAATLMAGNIAERSYTRGRRAFLAVLGVGIAGTLGWTVAMGSHTGGVEVVKHAIDSPFARALLLPFQPFARTVAATTIFPEMFGWGTVALLIDLTLAGLILRLDANFLEASVATSQKLYEQMKRVQQGTVWSAAKKNSGRSVPRLPHWGGVGPIFWRQLVTALRGSRSLLIMAGVMSIAFGIPMFATGRRVDENAAGAFSFGIVMSAMMFPQLIRFDFRSDLEKIETLKALPLKPLAVVVGQILTPVLMLTAGQLALFVAFVAFQGALPKYSGMMLPFVLPANWVMFCLENLLFLYFPYRLIAGGGIDTHAAGRQMLLLLLKLVLLGLIAGVAAGVGGLAYLATGSEIAAAVFACVTIFIFAAALVFPVAHAFARFDPSLDTPP